MTLIDILILTAALLALVVVIGIVTLAKGSPDKRRETFWAYETESRR